MYGPAPARAGLDESLRVGGVHPRDSSPARSVGEDLLDVLDGLASLADSPITTPFSSWNSPNPTAITAAESSWSTVFVVRSVLWRRTRIQDAVSLANEKIAPATEVPNEAIAEWMLLVGRSRGRGREGNAQ